MNEHLSENHIGTAPLHLLRRELAQRSLDGFLVGMADEYQNEYVPAHARRIAWLSGFTGSAGLIVVLAERAAVFTDGRYTLQVAEQVDAALFETHHISEEPPSEWLIAGAETGQRIGYDPWLFTERGIEAFAKAAAKAGAGLVALDSNPLDAVWGDQPGEPAAEVVPHGLAFAGESSEDKRQRMAEKLRQAGARCLVLTAPDSIAWLLNVRGGDVAHTPLPLSRALLRDDGHCDWFLAAEKRHSALPAHLGNQVTLRAPGEFDSALDQLGADKRDVQVDPASSAQRVLDRLVQAGATLIRADDPVQLAKACKNDIELNGIRAAHRRDGAAETKFLHWLASAAQDGSVDEIQAQEKLRAFRAAGEHFKDLSFDTISGAGPNGAIVHYKASEESNCRLAPGGLYLVDSGAQYLDGTTDITRTVAIGTPSAEMRDRFTRVLKGHIALASAIFPEGTTGSALDVLARAHLWQAGLDFDHGTGHGVGAYLGVHEGPQRISKIANTVALRPGMIISNEPGYYKTGAYGIRIENLVAVVEAGEIDGGERKMLAFETLTLAPIDRNLVDVALLDAAEQAWLDRYHARVLGALAPELDDDQRQWLASVTRPIAAEA